MNYQHSLWGDRLAAEYVLGTLHGAARRRFERLLPAHPSLQRAVLDWERQLNRLATIYPPIPPPPAVWHAVERRLFPTPSNGAWWHSVTFWRGLAFAGLLAVAVILASPLLWPTPEAELSFAAIRDKHHEVLWTVALTNDGRLHVSNLQAMAIPPDQRCFLWLKTVDSAPIMVGILPDDGSSRTLPMPADLPERARSVLWVTMQPMAPKPPPPVEPLYQTRWKAI